MLALVNLNRDASYLGFLLTFLFTAQHASAAPIRVVITEVTSIRFGHAAVNANNPSNAHLKPNLMIGDAPQLDDAGRHKKPHRHCGGGGLRNKALALSNAFRQALGLPLIETHARPSAAEKEIHGGIIRILPMPFVGTPSTHEGDEVTKGHHGHRFMRHRGSFLGRVHHALMALGPWEGRAVAFVLGKLSIRTFSTSRTKYYFQDAESVFS